MPKILLNIKAVFQQTKHVQHLICELNCRGCTNQCAQLNANHHGVFNFSLNGIRTSVAFKIGDLTHMCINFSKLCGKVHQKCQY
jgi:hypothetical protein